jgi:adenine phosphoribosyltransferase
LNLLSSHLTQDGSVDAALRIRLMETFRWLDPGPETTHLVSDMSGWWRDPLILGGVGTALADLYAAERPTVVISPGVTGFILGPLVAAALGVGFVEARKHDGDRRIAGPVLWGDGPPDYRGRTITLGVRADRIAPADRALLVDDWVVTGAQLRALRTALAQVGTTVVGAAVVVNGCDAATAATLGVRGLLHAADLPS